MFSHMRDAVPNALTLASQHPFNRQLYAGTLPRYAFNAYVRQDAYYLKKYAQALHLISQRLINKTHADKFKQFSQQIIRSEANLHLKYLYTHNQAIFFSAPKNSAPMQPVVNYVEHLNSLVQETKADVAIAVAALIPCYWLYSELGLQMQTQQPNINNPYYNWTSSYTREPFAKSAKEIIIIMDEITAGNTCKISQNKIIEAFKKSVYFELAFWDAVCLPQDQLQKEKQIYTPRGLVA